MGPLEIIALAMLGTVVGGFLLILAWQGAKSIWPRLNKYDLL